MSDTATPGPTTVTDGDWVVDSNSLAFPTSEADVRAALADSAEMPALQVDENGDELNSVVPKKSPDADPFVTRPAVPAEEGDEDAPKAPAPKAAAPAEPAKTAKKLSHEQRIAEINARIAERTRERREAERQATAAEERRRAALASAPPPDGRDAKPASLDAEVHAATAPGTGNEDLLDGKPEWSAYDAQGKDYKEFERDEKAWLRRTLETVSERAEARAMARAENQNSQTLDAIAHRERVAAAKAKYPDFEARRTALVGISTTPFLQNLITRNDAGMDVLYHLGANPDQAELLSALTHEDNDPRGILPQLFHAVKDMGVNPVPVVSYLATHPEEAQALLDLPPRVALVKIGQILSTAGTGAKNSGPSGKPASKPPIPFTPVDGGSSMRASADDDPEPDDTADDDAWFSWRERQRKRDRAKSS